MKHIYFLLLLACTNTAYSQFDQHLEFDGDEAHVFIEHDTPLNMTGNSMTIELRVWAADYDPGGWQEFVFKGGNAPFNPTSAYREYYMRPENGSGRAQFTIHDDQDNEYSSKSDSSLVGGQCYHLAGTFDGSVMKMYVNGVLEDVDTIGPITMEVDTGALAIARLGSRPTEEFEGEVGELRLWNFARSAEQICSTINDTLPPAYYTSADSGLVGYWRLNEGSGTIAYDLSVNGNHGELRDNPVYVPACASPACVVSVGENNTVDMQFGPNPVTGELFISSEYRIDGASLIDLSGRVVKIFKVNSSSPTLNMLDVIPGLYLLLLNADGREISRKILVSDR